MDGITIPETPVRLYLPDMEPHLSRTDGMGELSENARLLQDGEVAEWILLDGVRLARHNPGPSAHRKCS
jgi:hypothetical protein